MKWLTSGVPGLDQVLGGGIVAGSALVLAGDAGTGKTTLAQQISFANAAAEHPVIYYTALSEPNAKLVTHLEQFDFFERDRIGSQVEFIYLGELITHGNGDMSAVVAEVMRKVLEAEPVIVAIDNTATLRDYADERELRRAFYDLSGQLAYAGVTLLLVGDYPLADTQMGAEFALADSIVHLAYEAHEPVDQRWLRAVKVRHAKHLTGKHALTIDTTGCTVFPRVETLNFGEPTEVTDRIPSGIPGLDDIMGGGIGRYATCAILGPSGSGKTILSLQFIHEGLKRQEGCLYVTFQDTPNQLFKTATSFGIDLQTPQRDGRLIIHHVPSDQLNLDILAAGISQSLAGGGIRRVVIDSLGEMVVAARESERFPAYMRSLIGLIRNAGANLLVTSETTMIGPALRPAEESMFLFHNVIMMRYVELPDRIGRALNVLKMRNSEHSTQLHELHIGKHGMKIERPLPNVSGALGWSVLRATVNEPGV
ncbi:ATPase domain-containing protein [Actinoplanes regularis]|uniref:non-specific serine/threonine protein kinase n=1 Tax=Actinoplanes regularis TaxID=52697 RepID=A0A239KBU8_9ACTN|nr:ATPase domain-containing protein [Actinoplanes regularis]GIE92466.1 circadian clock protein KaiC [Actinoplanes regularis]SNT15089.1 circadian clock protein KaiC [Actinoplanes regularis]